MFNLFRLHDGEKDNTVYKWLLVSGTSLDSIVEEILNKIYKKVKRRELDSLLTKRLKISDITSQRLRRKGRIWYPIVFLDTILRIYEDLFKKDITTLRYNILTKIEKIKSNNPISKPIYAVKELSEQLCKIVGAHVADGTLNFSFIRITDENKQSIYAFKNWVEEVFKLDLPEVKAVKDSNEWSLAFKSKPISRYFIKFFGIPSGIKTYTTDEPCIIKNADLKFRKSFALGVLTFDGGLGIKPSVALCVSSRKLRNSIAEILTLHDVEIKIPLKKTGKYWRFWSKDLKKESAAKWLDFFEKGTEKWFKLFEIINGFQGKPNSPIEVFDVFNKVYGRKSGSKVTLNEIFQILLENQEVYRYQIVDILEREGEINFGGKWAHSLKTYLDILKLANIINVQKRKFGYKKSFGRIIRDVYKLNENLDEWRIPHRPWFEN